MFCVGSAIGSAEKGMFLQYRPRMPLLRPRPTTAPRLCAHIRDVALERGGRRCALCGSSRRLELHHRPRIADDDDPYRHAGHETAEDLTLLCFWCHDLFTAAQMWLR